MSSDVIRIVVCGDDAVGKSSLIAALLKEEFVPNIQRVIPPVTISREDYAANANDFISENEIPVKESKGKKGLRRQHYIFC